MNQKLEYSTYKDKVLGGWVGKCAGGILGAPIEGFKHFNNIANSDKLFETNFANDDLDLQVLWLDMLLKKGSKVRGTDFKMHWEKHVDFPWCEYGIASRNIAVGLDSPDTGSHNNDYWNSGMGSPIRSEIWGMVNPGDPKTAAYFARLDSELDHAGFSVEAEAYLSACAAIAFFESDLKKILLGGLDYVESEGACYKLVHQIITWNERHSTNIVQEKIKSYYGDADFTNAPMNIAFTIHALLNAQNSFDFIIDALHLGHDSDCIVATAGALLGIALGHQAIPQKWKDRVGNELLVSPEIVGIYCPATITELTDLTCKAGYQSMKDPGLLQGLPQDIEPLVYAKSHDLYCTVESFPPAFQSDPLKLKLHYENQSTEHQNVQIEFISNCLESKKLEFSLAPGDLRSESLVLEVYWDKLNTQSTELPYQVEVSIQGKHEQTHVKGIPYYGNWLLLGPFIEDDPELVQSEFKYPDHGMSSLPSVRYMNQDKAKSTTNFLDPEKVEAFIENKSVFDQGFHAEVIHPLQMRFDLGEYFHGQGERSLYLYTEFKSEEATKQWLTFGAHAYLSIWFNGALSHQSDVLQRSYPLSHALELDVQKGVNKILVRMDATLDDYRLEIGLKHHQDKHPHQCLWNTDLQFDVMHRLEKINSDL